MSEINLKWYFPSTGGGDEQGINDSLRETFEGDHERYIARESIQNSMDARIDYQQPVKVRFERIDLEASQIPGVDELRQTILKALDYAGEEERAGSYATALQALDMPTVSVLKISDFNTTGLSGSDQKQGGGGWYKLVRATGVNAMNGVGGGSFGIGKGAPFAASSLRTVFYSTVNEEGEAIFQGKARLSSFLDNNDVRQGVGQFGIFTEEGRGVSSVRDRDYIPAFFQRTEMGTDVFVIGYQTTEQDWRKLLINSILNNFWAAIHFDDLDVELVEGDERLTISQENLSELMLDYSAGKDGSYHFYSSVVEPTHEFSETLPLLGDVKLYVRVEAGFPKKVQMMRKSKMVVCTNSFRVMPEPYAGVFICESEEGNRLLRNLEPPAHDEWDSQRDKENGRKIFKELNDWVRGSLRELAGTGSNEPEDIPGVSEYLPELDERDDMKPYFGGDGQPTYRGSDEETPLEMGATHSEQPYNPSVIKQPRPVTMIIPDSGSGDVDPKPHKNKGITPEPGERVDPDVDGDLPRISTSSIDYKIREIVKDGERLYQAVINPLEDTNGSIRLMAVGDDNDYPVEIAATFDESGTEYLVDNSFVRGLQLTKGDRLKLFIRLKRHKRYVLGVETNEG